MVVYDDVEKAGKERVVYFAERYDGAVKIGTSRRLYGRKKELEFLLGDIQLRYVFASSKFESELHRRYKTRCIHNETFSVPIKEIIVAVESEYDEKDYIQKPSHRKENDMVWYALGDFDTECENISKLKLFKECFDLMTFDEILCEYNENNKENGNDIDTSWIEDKTDLFISMYEAKMPGWVFECMIDYDIDKIEHEYWIYFIVQKILREKNAITTLSFVDSKVQELESKIATFIEMTDTDGKNDKEIYQMVKKWIDGGAK